MAVTGQFFGLPAATLSSLLTSYMTALTAIATTGQSYSIAGRSFTRGDLPELRQTIAEIVAAQNRAAGTTGGQKYAAFGSPYGS